MRGMPFFSFTWPSQCWVCGSWPVASGVCQDCYCCFRFVGQRCMGCALSLPAFSSTQIQNPASYQVSCQVEQGFNEVGYRRGDACQTLVLCVSCQQKNKYTPLQRCAAAVDYAYPWSQLLSAYKRHKHIGLARVLARVMLQTPDIVSLLHSCDYVIPVPLSAERLSVRGFNQSLQLAYALCRYSACRCQVLPYALQRVRNTTEQGPLTAAQRVANVQHAFALSARCPAPWYGKKLLLLDDVMTTGASLIACARALLPLAPTALSAMVCMRTAVR